MRGPFGLRRRLASHRRRSRNGLTPSQSPCESAADGTGWNDYNAGMTSDDLPHPAGSAGFRTTRWSVVVAASGDSAESQQALQALCGTYWFPLYAYVRRRVQDRSEAEDLTQAFFAELLEKEHVAAATPERGRFRAFLLVAFKHFLSKQWEKGRAQKRGGGRTLLSLDFEAGDSQYKVGPAQELAADQLYDKQWALTTLQTILDRLESEYQAAGKGRQFDLLRGAIIGDHAGPTYREIADHLDMTEAAIKMAVQRMRGRYRSLLRSEIADTVSDPGEVDEEIRRLFEILSA